MSLGKQVSGVWETNSNITVLAKLGLVPFKIRIETQIFKYLNVFPF